MAQTIKLKRSATAGNTPTTSQLSLGEIAINTTDGKLFIKRSVGGTESIVEVGGLPLSGGTLTGNLSLGDNVKAQFGAGNDLEIYSDTSNGRITAPTLLQVQTNELDLVDGSATSYFMKANTDEVSLYSSGFKKLSTSSDGIVVYGQLSGTSLDALTLLSGGTNLLDIFSTTSGSTNILTVEDNLILNNTTTATTSQAIYGINVITGATTTDLATKLPVAVTGKQTTFVNKSTMPILVFPSAVGGEINGLVDGYATIPNDSKPYTFYCIENPLPGAWTWSAPTLGQIQLSTIEVSHTNGAQTQVYGVGNPGAQLVNPAGPNWYDDIYGTYAGAGVITLSPSSDYWATSTLAPNRTLVRTKVYSNILDADKTLGFGPTVAINRYVSYMTNPTTLNNYTASSTGFGNNENVAFGVLNSPVEIGDAGTQFKINESNLVQASPASTDTIGVAHYFTFGITIPSDYVTKVYKFNIFLEHS